MEHGTTNTRNATRQRSSLYDLLQLTSLHEIQHCAFTDASVRTRNDGCLAIQSGLTIILGATNHREYTLHSLQQHSRLECNKASTQLIAVMLNSWRCWPRIEHTMSCRKQTQIVVTTNLSVCLSMRGSRVRVMSHTFIFC